jgi:hypothetical protein
LILAFFTHTSVRTFARFEIFKSRQKGNLQAQRYVYPSFLSRLFSHPQDPAVSESLSVLAHATPDEDTVLLEVTHGRTRDPSSRLGQLVAVVVVIGFQVDRSPLALTSLAANSLPHGGCNTGGCHAQRRNLEHPDVVEELACAGMTLGAGLALTHGQDEVLTTTTHGDGLEGCDTARLRPYLRRFGVDLCGFRVGVTLQDGLPATPSADGDLTLGALVIKGLDFEMQEVQLSSKLRLTIEATEAEETALADADGSATSGRARGGGELAPGAIVDIESPDVVGALAIGEAAGVNEECTITVGLLVNGIFSDIANNGVLRDTSLRGVA